MTENWLDLARRLHGIASTGLFFGASDYDKERYAEVGKIAESMLADLASVPITRIRELVPDYAQGYATPQIDVRGAVFRAGRILLVKEKTDGLWTLPGGYADVGLSAGENVVKEIWEEANVPAEVAKLFAVRHKAKHPYRGDARDFYKFYFLCEARGDATPSPGPETDAAEYFDLDALPLLSRGRTIEADIVLAEAHRANPDLVTEFD